MFAEDRIFNYNIELLDKALSRYPYANRAVLVNRFKSNREKVYDKYERWMKLGASEEEIKGIIAEETDKIVHFIIMRALAQCRYNYLAKIGTSLDACGRQASMTL